MRALILFCLLCVTKYHSLEQSVLKPLFGAHAVLRAETFECISHAGLLLLLNVKSVPLCTAVCTHLVGLSHCVVRVMWFKYWILPDAVLLSSQLAGEAYTETPMSRQKLSRCD